MIAKRFSPYRILANYNTPKAFVVFHEGVAASPELARELQNLVKHRITPYKYPHHIEFMATLPKSAAGKLLRYKLRELATNSFKL